MSALDGGAISGSGAGPGFNRTTYTQPTVASATPTAWTTGNSPVALFTVTGTILCRTYGVVGATALTSTGATGTLSVGVAGNTACLLPVTTVSGGGQFLINGAWVDSTPTVTAKLLATATSPWVLLTGNIILTVATNSMTAGAIVMVCEWVAVTAGATVVQTAGA